MATPASRNTLLRLSLLIFIGILLCTAIIAVLTLRQSGKHERVAVNQELLTQMRSLSQQVTYQSEALLNGETSVRSDLVQNVSRFDNYLKLLREGGYSSRISAEIPVEPLPDADSLKPKLITLAKFWKRYRKRINTVADNAAAATTDAAAAFMPPGSEQVNPELTDAGNYMRDRYKDFERLTSDLADSYNNYRQDTRLTYTISTVLSALLTVGLAVVFYLLTFYRLVQPIRYLRDFAARGAGGQREQDERPLTRNDEIGDLAHLITRLNSTIRNAADFANNLRADELRIEYPEQIDKSKRDRRYYLPGALVSLRDKLLEVAETDRRRNWRQEGINTFISMLRNRYSELEQLAGDIIETLVTYVDAVQGAVYVSEQDEQGNDTQLIQAGVYAYDRRKAAKLSLDKNIGLVGQAYREGKTIYLDKVPEDYLSIKTGLLGELPPKSILIVPLILNRQKCGVLEVAYLRELEDYEVEFVRRVSRNISAAILTFLSDYQTEVLLNEAQEAAGKLREQERMYQQQLKKLEEARQETDAARRELEIRERVFDRSYYVIEFDPDMMILDINPHTLKRLGFSKSQLVGRPLSNIIDDLDMVQQAIQQTAGGEAWQGSMYVLTAQNELRWMRGTFAAVIEEDGAVSRYVVSFVNLQQLKEQEELLKQKNREIEQQAKKAEQKAKSQQKLLADYMQKTKTETDKLKGKIADLQAQLARYEEMQTGQTPPPND